MNTHNLDKLPADAKNLIAWIFENLPCGWTNTYMIEVRLDDPVEHILGGGDGFLKHGGSGSRCYAKHAEDPAWAVVHVDDEDWRRLEHESMAEAGEVLIQQDREETLTAANGTTTPV